MRASRRISAFSPPRTLLEISAHACQVAPVGQDASGLAVPSGEGAPLARAASSCRVRQQAASKRTMQAALERAIEGASKRTM